VKRLSGSRASTVFMIERMGVMPLPPAMPRWWRLAAGLDGDEEAALRRHDADRCRRAHALVDPVGEGAALDAAHAHAQFAVIDAGADRIRAAQVLAVDVGRSVRYWPWVKPKVSRSSGGTSKETMDLASSVSGSMHAQGWTVRQVVEEVLRSA
jgi:hypothetical protein